MFQANRGAGFSPEFKTILSTYRPVHADRRIVILFVSDGEGRVRAKRISDSLSADEDEED